MTTNIILFTSSDKAKVDKAVREVGFKEPTKPNTHYTHNAVDGLVLQIIGRDTIMMEFGWGDEFPDDPEAVKVLKELYGRLPDITYKGYSFPPNLTPEGRLSEFLDSLDS